jgi:transposase InsO family protein
MKYTFMKNNSMIFPVKKMAQMFQVSPSSYYAWLKRKPSAHEFRDAELVLAIKRTFSKYRERYGSPRIYKYLRGSRYSCARSRVARLMRESGLVARHKRRFKVTTDSKHDHPISPNLVDRNFSVDSVNTYWVSDITYIATVEGWLYLCTVIDLFSRKVVGWSMASHMRAELAIDALDMAVKHRNPHKGLIFHSDCGIQYASIAFREKLESYKMIQSMSRKGNCWDNAPAESFFSTLKMEEVYLRKYQSREEARQSIFEYIEVFYNRQRSHSFLDYMSPAKYEELSLLKVA